MTEPQTSNPKPNQTAYNLAHMQRTDPGSEQPALILINLVVSAWHNRHTILTLITSAIVIATAQHTFTYFLLSALVIVAGLHNHNYLRPTTITYLTVLTTASAIAGHLTAAITNPGAANLIHIAITTLITSLSMTTAYILKPTAYTPA